jgi:hypothetical protein|tara:strand:+ start:442 stop:801 length:360 start_codon:yes stop_codon:yes gene_type:complete
MGPVDKSDKLNYCKWCGKKTYMEPMNTAETPILEFLEDEINKHGREEVWGEYGDWSEEFLDSDFEAQLLVYDEMLNTISKKIVCITCLKYDDDLFKKYYGYESEDNPDDDEDHYIIELE